MEALSRVTCLDSMKMWGPCFGRRWAAEWRFRGKMSCSGQPGCPREPHSLCLPGYHKGPKTKISRELLGLSSLNKEQPHCTAHNMVWGFCGSCFGCSIIFIRKWGSFCQAMWTLQTMQLRMDSHKGFCYDLLLGMCSCTMPMETPHHLRNLCLFAQKRRKPTVITLIKKMC